MLSQLFIRIILTLGISIATFAHAADSQDADSLALRTIMQELARNMQSLNTQMYTEDWKAVADIAQKIATHDEPPIEEKKQILQWLGENAKSFRNHDLEVKAGAQDLSAAARSEDIKGIMTALNRVQGNCLACHQGFRNDFIQHFYAK